MSPTGSSVVHARTPGQPAEGRQSGADGRGRARASSMKKAVIPSGPPLSRSARL